MLQKYFINLYQRTMQEAYALAHREIAYVLQNGGKCLDCGAGVGHKYDFLQQVNVSSALYHGIEWNDDLVGVARGKGLNVIKWDLNKGIGFPDSEFRCIFGLSVLEHLLNPCRYLSDCYRCLEKRGVLVILTPNISTYFTVAMLLLGKMPSSGPHPDSNNLLKQEEIFKVSQEGLQPDAEVDSPVHRHLIVFSYRVLKLYLKMIGFEEVKGFGFGVYPFPNFTQPLLEKVDPFHCHQMVFIARK